MKKKLKSIIDYADICGVSRQTVYNRINDGSIKADRIVVGDNVFYLIDMAKYPPITKHKTGRKKIILTKNQQVSK